MKKLLLLTTYLFISIFAFSQFGPEQEISKSAGTPREVKTTDLDGDGDMDVLTASSGDNKIAWYENEGNGTFGVQQIISTNAHGARSVFSSDLDGDGDLDVLSASESDDKIAWYENDGNGNFGTQQIISVNADGARSVFSVDIDDDGDMDVLSASFWNDAIIWYENDGNGNFQNSIFISNSSNGASSVFCVDIDGDGDMDVLSASENDNKIEWFENVDGYFGAGLIITTDALWAKSVYSADLDGDGDMDVLSASFYDKKIAWYENDGFGNFSGQLIIDANQTGANSVFSSDIDGDGDMDVLSTGGTSNIKRWYENDGNGNFGEPQSFLGYTDGPNSVITSDIDNDGDLDVLFSSISNKVFWYENDGLGGFSELQLITNGIRQPKSVYCVDLDGDNDIDVLAASYGDDKIVWYENDGTGNFGLQNIISTSANGARSVYSTDLDGDGDLDVLSASYLDNTIEWYENDGSGNFGLYNVIGGGDDASSVYSADIDNDDDMDVLAASFSDDKIAWYENDGFGNFGNQQIISTNADGAMSVYSADLDGDGDMDVLSASLLDDKIAMYRNNGYGDFVNQELISTNAISAYSVHCVDINGDGDLDILSASQEDNKIAKYNNLGNGYFGTQQVISLNADEAKFVYSADINGDGSQDVLFASSGDDKIAWHANSGNGNFGGENVISTMANGASSVFSADLDGDGDMDVISASEYDSKIAWYENLYGGCTDSLACNYNSMQDIDNGSCCYGECGCTDSNADNYSSSTICEDGSCIYLGCLDYSACNYAPDANTDDGSCILPNGCTDSNADNYSSTATCEDGSCIYLGCIDNTACNFDITANTDDGSCILPDGCTDPISNNYNSMAECDDGSCEYSLYGTVFFDENENGIMDGAEYGLPFQEVILEPGGLMGITNDEGNFFFSGPGNDSFTLTLNPSETFPYVTTTNPIAFDIVFGGADQELLFGVSNEYPDFAVCVDFYPSGNGYPCNDFVNHNICYRNMGNVPIDGIVEVEFDALFQGYQEVTPIDSVVGNHIYMSFENLLPGQMFFYDVYLQTPTVDFIGEWLTSTARVYGYYEEEQVAYGESILVQEMTCSYDPNDKQVFPVGYEEPHYVLNDTELEYLVRFQNTGNAAAINVTVSDTIDENLDLSTFMLMANSHSVMTSIDPESRVIDFFFENIMLPDSTTDEQGSHGLISYLIRPYPELDIETEINNTGYIYFDNNPAIVTNTTWTTIYGCSNDLATIETETLIACEGAEFAFSNTQEYIESYEWTMDEEILGTNPTLQNLFESNGEYSIKLNVSNPLCEAIDSVMITVNPSPEVLAGDDQIICFGDSAMLLGNWGLNFEWIDLGTDSTYQVSPEENTTYTLQAVNEFECENSDEIEVVVNPIPEVLAGEDQSICLGESATLLGNWGPNFEWIDLGTDSTYIVSPEENTTFTLQAVNEFECESSDDVDVVVNPLPEVSAGEDQDICFGESATLLGNWGENFEWIDLGTDSTYIVSPQESTTYTLHAVNEFECENSDEVEIVVNPLPTIDITENQDICEGETVVLTVSGGETYDWDGLSDEDSIEVTPDETTSYEVSVTNEFDCMAGAEVTVFVNPLPEASFTEDGITLTASAGTSFQWYLNGTEIEGAIDQSYTISEDGNYSVLVTNEFDCSSLSGEVFVMYIGIMELDNESIKLYPNPMAEMSYLFFEEDCNDCTIRLTASNGQLIREYESITGNKLTIERKGLSAGTYVLQVVSGDKRVKEFVLIVE